jgi:hypothetical protein
MNKYLNIVVAILFASIFFYSCGSDDESTEPSFSCSDGIQNGDETGIDCGGDCDSCFSVGSEGPASGTVFYDKGTFSNGWQFLEAAPSDQEVAVIWSSKEEFAGSTSTSIGSGFENAGFVFDDQGVTIGSALHAGSSLELGDAFDWFLPSSETLLLMYENRNLIGQFTNGQYWSSSEINAAEAWLVDFSNGQLRSESKFNEFRVRAVRRF